MNLEEKTLSSQKVFEGKIITVKHDTVLLPDNGTAKREIIEHPGGVCVAAINEKDEILFVRQFRYPYGQTILEIPAGKRDKGEEPFITGQRELLEETGAVAKDYVFLGELYPTPGYCGEIIWMYGAKNLTFQNQKLDSDEFLEVYKIPLKKAVEMILSGEIKDAKTQAAVLKLNILRQEGKF